MVFKANLLLLLAIFTFTGCSAQKTKPESVTRPVTINAPVYSSSRKPIYQIFYGTNREPNDPNDLSKGYNNKRSDKLYTGTCDVFIPKSHKVGEIKGSLKDKIIHFDFSYGDLKLRKITSYSTEKELWANLQSIFDQTGEKEALIFIHGYNNSFEDAAIRAAQLGYDLGVKGVTAFFSWPSAADPLLYSSDEATIQASEKYIKQFIRGFAKKSGANKVHIIAHSMGNRGLLRAINDIEKETPDVRFGQIILAAPDVDADLFKNISDAYTKLSDRTTLYVSPRDKAVWMSKIKHQHPRAGVVKPVSVVKNIDTVQVNFDFDLLALGHTYFAQEEIILRDIVSLLNNNSNPKSRKWLIPNRNKNHQKFWILNLQ